MTITELRSEMKAGMSGGYLFYGNEDYQKKIYADKIKAKYQSSTMIDGTEPGLTSLALIDKIINAILSQQMMFDNTGNNIKYIEIRDPNLTPMKENELDAFVDALNMLKDYNGLILVIIVTDRFIDFGSPPKRPSTVFKRLCETIVPVEFMHLTLAKLCTWGSTQFDHENVEIAADAVKLLIERCGYDMFRLSSEIEKLCAWIKCGQAENLGKLSVDVDAVTQITTADISDDAFELANGILASDSQRIFEALNSQKERRVEPVLVMAEVSRVWCDLLQVKAEAESGLSVYSIAAKLKMHEYRVGLYYNNAKYISLADIEKIVCMCSEADYKLKTSQLGYIPIERLVCAALAMRSER